jgi:hypothetical protein
VCGENSAYARVLHTPISRSNNWQSMSGTCRLNECRSLHDTQTSSSLMTSTIPARGLLRLEGVFFDCRYHKSIQCQPSWLGRKPTLWLHFQEISALDTDHPICGDDAPSSVLHSRTVDWIVVVRQTLHPIGRNHTQKYRMTGKLCRHLRYLPLPQETKLFAFVHKILALYSEPAG